MAGVTQLSRHGPDTQQRWVRRLVLHRDYSSVTESHDVALVQLDRPVRCGPRVQLACVPPAPAALPALSDCFVSGWGSTDARGERAPAAPGGGAAEGPGRVPGVSPAGASARSCLLLAATPRGAAGVGRGGRRCARREGTRGCWPAGAGGVPGWPRELLASWQQGGERQSQAAGTCRRR